jgi:hypothetical protein
MSAQAVEVIVAPLTVWVAPVGTAFPKIDAEPAEAWIKLGANGNKNYEDDGVTVTHDQTLESFRGAGSTGKRKVYRTEENLMVAFTLVDLTAAQYAKILNDATVTTEAAGAEKAGQKYFDLLQGLSVAQFALLARGTSAESADLNAQYDVARCVQSGKPAPVFSKGKVTGLATEWDVLEDDESGFGKHRIQTAAATE